MKSDPSVATHEATSSTEPSQGTSRSALRRADYDGVKFLAPDILANLDGCDDISTIAFEAYHCRRKWGC
jgi:hypothetical protein